MNREYIRRHPWMAAWAAIVLALPALLPFAASAEPHITLSIDPSKDIFEGTVIHFSITGDLMDDYSLMAVTPDSRQEFAAGAEGEYQIGMPGRHVFIGYGKLGDQIYMTDMVTVTAREPEILKVTEEEIRNREAQKEAALNQLTDSYQRMLDDVDHSFTVTYINLYQENMLLRWETSVFKTFTNPGEAIMRVINNESGNSRKDLYEKMLMNYLNNQVPEYSPPDFPDTVAETVDTVLDEANLAMELLKDIEEAQGNLISTADKLKFIAALIKQYKASIEKWQAMDILMQQTQQNLEKLNELRDVFSSPEMTEAIDRLSDKILSGLGEILPEMADPNSEIMKYLEGLAADTAYNVIPGLGSGGTIAKVLDKIWDEFSGGKGINHFISDKESLNDHYTVMLTARDALSEAVAAEDWEAAKKAAEFYYAAVKDMYETFQNMDANDYKEEVQADLSRLSTDYEGFRQSLYDYQALQ